MTKNFNSSGWEFQEGMVIIDTKMETWNYCVGER